MVAAIRGRTAVSIGIPWSWAMRRYASDSRRGVKPFASYSPGDSDSPTIRTSQTRSSP
jgi:hypothetical protein